MNWINIRTEQMRSPAVALASHEALGTWVRVLAYCCEQENGGTIIGGAEWNERAWMIACGVTIQDLKKASPLISKNGKDVIVSMYPMDKQKEVQKDRRNGSKGGRCKTQAKTQASRENGTQGGRPKNPSQNPTERKGKEGNNNGKESFPEVLDNPEFQTAWKDWEEARRQAKHGPYTEIGRKMQLKALAEIGAERAVRAIHHSIANGYQGIFEPKSASDSKPRVLQNGAPKAAAMPTIDEVVNGSR